MLAIHSRVQSSPTALLVIDVQASFTECSYWRTDDLVAYWQAQNALIQGFVAQQLPVIRVYHIEESGAFAKSSGLVRPLTGLMDFTAALEIEKYAHSAFVGTPLAGWLRARGIHRVAVSGIRSEQCCETTTRHAYDLGFQVDYVTEATLTFAMQAKSALPVEDTGADEGGAEYTQTIPRIYRSQEIKERCELVLADRFATICTVQSALARAQERNLQL